MVGEGREGGILLFMCKENGIVDSSESWQWKVAESDRREMGETKSKVKHKSLNVFTLVTGTVCHLLKTNILVCHSL